MKYEDRFLVDDLEEELDLLDEDINNIQTAIFRLQDVFNDSFDGIIKQSIIDLEFYLKWLERKKDKLEEKISKLEEI